MPGRQVYPQALSFQRTLEIRLIDNDGWEITFLNACYDRPPMAARLAEQSIVRGRQRES